MEQIKSRKYESINVKSETKVRVDKKYYEIKVREKFKTFDEFINYLLDKFEEK